MWQLVYNGFKRNFLRRKKREEKELPTLNRNSMVIKKVMENGEITLPEIFIKDYTARSCFLYLYILNLMADKVLLKGQVLFELQTISTFFL